MGGPLYITLTWLQVLAVTPELRQLGVPDACRLTSTCLTRLPSLTPKLT